MMDLHIRSAKVETKEKVLRSIHRALLFVLILLKLVVGFVFEYVTTARAALLLWLSNSDGN